MGIVAPKALSLSQWKYQDLKEHVVDTLTSERQVAHFRCLCILLDRWGSNEFRDRPLHRWGSNEFRDRPLQVHCPIRSQGPVPGGVRAVLAVDRLHRRDLDAEARKPD